MSVKAIDIINESAKAFPAYSGNVFQTYKDFAPQLEQVGADVQRKESLHNQSLQKLINPELYANRQLLGQKQKELYSDVERLNGFSGSEREEANRYIARSDSETGNSGLGGTSNVLSNALRFGNLGRAHDAQYIAAKQGAISNGAAIAPTLDSGNMAKNMGGSQFNFGEQGANTQGITARNIMHEEDIRAGSPSIMSQLPDYS